MTKFKDAGAYVIAEDVSNAEEAAKAGLAVVEVHPTTGAPTKWGRYKDAPDGGPLGITAAKPADTEVRAGGAVSGVAAPSDIGDGKGYPDDPFAHQVPGEPPMHEDNAPPGVVVRDDADERLVAPQEPKKAAKPAKKAAKPAKK